jgi:hypothetical protein
MIAPTAFAASTSNNQPVVVIQSVTVSGPSATVTYTINRGGNQIVSPNGLTCSLTGPTASTTTPTSCGRGTTARGTTSNTVVLTGLQSGTYTFTVNLLLTDGETATATTGSFAPFTVSCVAGQPNNLQATINAAPSGSTIPVSGTCTGNFTIDKDEALQGQGGAILDGNNSGLVLKVDSGVVTLNSLIIQRGDGFFGGGIQNFGTLTLNSSQVSNNNGHGGGGIASGSTPTSTGTVTLNSSSVSGNAADFGGGIWNNFGSVIVNSSSVFGNTTSGPDGDGAGIDTESGTVSLTSSSVYGNTASSVGGGLHSINGTMTLISSSVSNNTANGGSGSGGGIRNDGGTVDLQPPSSVTGNTPDNCAPENTILGCTN